MPSFPLQTVKSDLTQARMLMVEGQVRPNRVTTAALLERLEAIPRELFVAPEQQNLVYREGDCQIDPASAPGRTLLAPMVLARMIEALEIKSDDQVLTVGGATGYGAAVLSALGTSVTMLEPDASLARQAESNMRTLDASNVMVKTGGVQSLPTLGTYSAILVEGAVTEIPAALIAALVEGGRLVAIIGGAKGTRLGSVTLVEKFHGTPSQRTLFEAGAAYVPGFGPRDSFRF